MSGWIKLHRQLIEWEWYTEPNTFRLFMHCLLRANHSDSKWRGKEIKRGQFITSVDTLMAELELSRSKVRTALKNLESTNEIAMSISTRSRVVTVLQYDSYQDLATTSPSDNHEIANRSPTDDQPIATDKNVKKNKNDKKEPLKPIVVPTNINPIAWSEWTEYRKSKKKPISIHAAKKQFKLLSSHDFDQQQLIINKSIQNDYQGLFDPQEQSNGQNNNSSQSPRLSALDRVKQGNAERQREREKADLEAGNAMGETGGDVRLQISQSVRGETGQYVDDVLEGHFIETDG